MEQSNIMNFQILSAKELIQFGCIDSLTIDDDNRASVWAHHGVYQVGGFHNGEHFRTSHGKKSDAYKSANRIKRFSHG
jgi:hypothetical protein